MADVTISDLELAPALADDMVFPVENLTDTYAATLAMLRRLLNKTFVEEEDADFNDLTEDGFYQCTGTPTNSPVAGSIVWTLQVSTQGGVTVQRAFSLDDDFANLYIRRWNGVTWTTWIEEGGGALTNKANIDLDNLSATGNDKFVTKDTVQTISATKTFSAVPVMTETLTATDNSTKIPTTAWVRNHRCTSIPTTSSTASADAPAYVVVNYKNNSGQWYRKYSDGFIEQSGSLTLGTYGYNFLTPFSATPTVLCSRFSTAAVTAGVPDVVDLKAQASTAGFTLAGTNFNSTYFVGGRWFACGY